MEENSILLALCLIVFQIITIILLKKADKKQKKDLAHYEAIADEHIRKMYKPVSVCMNNIWLLLFAGFFLSNKELIILFIFWNVLQTISTKLTMLISSLDITQLKQGLISMDFDYNAYFESWNVKVEYDENNKYIYYMINNKVVRHHSIDTKGLSKEQIDDTVYWHKKRFKDYLRYIPKEVLQDENVIDKLEDWFIYLDDVRANF